MNQFDDDPVMAQFDGHVVGTQPLALGLRPVHRPDRRVDAIRRERVLQVAALARLARVQYLAGLWHRDRQVTQDAADREFVSAKHYHQPKNIIFYGKRVFADASITPPV